MKSQLFVIAACSLALTACSDGHKAADNSLKDAEIARNSGSYEAPSRQRSNEPATDDPARPSSGKLASPPPASERPGPR
jgi:hypothetical protein